MKIWDLILYPHYCFNKINHHQRGSPKVTDNLTLVLRKPSLQDLYNFISCFYYFNRSPVEVLVGFQAFLLVSVLGHPGCPH